MRAPALLRPVGWALAAAGAFAAAIAGLLAAPLSQPPVLTSIHEGAMAIDDADRPTLSRFQARDGTFLAYRLYPATNGATDHLAILVHGSSGSSAEMNAAAHALAENGVAAAAIDTRGHGASGTRGDIGYIGQLDDDLADLVAEFRAQYPKARLTLIGHSSGGGFVLRVAGEAEGRLFDRFVLLAPYLGYFAPTNRPSEGKGRWADADVPRIVALAALRRLGVDWGQSLPVIAFANAPSAYKNVTSRYSYRLLTNFGPPPDWKSAFEATAAPIDVIVGENDELMDAGSYAPALAPHAARTSVTVLPGIDHMGVVRQPAALAAMVTAAKR
jgi:alpha-beta hydrolase superfamily lysophospholipase